MPTDTVTPPNANNKMIVIDGENYALTTVPDASSKLVLDTKNRVLGELKLDDLLKNLALVGKMLYIAYNGVASQPKLRGEISTLQVNYMRLCADSQQAMGAFDTNCESMLRHLKSLFNYLLAQEEDTALLYIGYMAKVAREMASTATTLKESFNGLFLQATQALAGAETAKGTEEEKKAALEREKANFEALSEKARVLSEELAKSKAKLQELYDEAKAAAEKHENRAFALAIVGAIMKPLGDGLGAFAGAMASSKIPITLPTAPPTSTTPPKNETKPDDKKDEAVEAKKKELAEAEEDVKKTKKVADEKEEEAKEAKEASEEAEEKAEAAKKEAEEAEEKGADDVEEKKAAAKEAEDEAEDLKEESDKADEAYKTAKTAYDQAAEKHRLIAASLKGLGAALSGAGEAATEMGKSYSEIAANYNKEKQEYLKRLLDEQKLERETLASIAEYAKRMQNIGTQVEVAKVVIDALHQAVGALKQIVVILSNAADLWLQMARHCTELSNTSDTFKDRIELWKTKPNRAELYMSTTFAEDAVRHYADWRALQLISKEYSKAANQVKTEVQTNITKNVSSKDMLQIAISEGKALFSSTNADMSKLDKEESAIQEELKEIQKLGPVANA